MLIKRFFISIFISIFAVINVPTNNVINESEEIPTTFKVSSGRTSSLLLSNQGIVYGWGLWGEGSNVTLSKKLISPTNISSNIVMLEDERFIDIFTGEQHCFMLTNLGRVFAMGSGEKRQLGYVDYLFKSTPTEITSLFNLNDDKVRFIGCGDDFNIVLTSKNKVLSFGLNEDGQLGVGKDEEDALIYDITDKFQLQDGDYIKDVKCGASHVLALSNNGYVYVWGSNKFGQLGMPEVLYLDEPTQLNTITESIIDIDCGRFTSYVLTNQAQLYGFGSDSHGQLATHDSLLSSNKKESPYLMNSGFTFESDEYIKDITAGYYFAIVKTNLNNFYSFGQNSSGQLSNGSSISTSVPSKIEYKSFLSSLDEIDSISCGQDHCIAISKYSHILAWGSNLQNQLSEDASLPHSFNKMIDITYNFPPIILISTNASSVEYKTYVLDVSAYYLDNEPITSTYYCITDSLTIPTSNWTLLEDNIILSEQEGIVYVHLKVESEKGTYYHVSSPYKLDHINPTIKVYDTNNQEILSPYTNSTIFVEAIDNNSNVEIVYSHNGTQYSTSSDTLTLINDGTYVIYAKDEANNSSATIEFTIDTILPTITKIDNNLIQNSSYSTKEKQITIYGSEALNCYSLGYKGVQSSSLTALNENESSFTIKLKKGVNTLTVYDLAGNQSLTYEIIYSPRFFQDTQLLLIVFGSLAALFIILIIIVYTIKNKKKLTN